VMVDHDAHAEIDRGPYGVQRDHRLLPRVVRPAGGAVCGSKGPTRLDSHHHR